MQPSAQRDVTAPPPGKAQLVILRPSSYAYNYRFPIVDQHGRFLGHALAESRHSVFLEPGFHRIYAWGSQVSVVSATVEAGQTYFVVARPHPGALRAAVNLTALTPSSPDWPKLETWIGATENMSYDFTAAQREMSGKAAQVRAKIAAGDARWQRMSERQRLDRTLEPEHGI